jgi:hypothetical protein
MLMGPSVVLEPDTSSMSKARPGGLQEVTWYEVYRMLCTIMTLASRILVPHRYAPPGTGTFPTHCVPPARRHHHKIARLKDRLHTMRPYVLHEEWIGLRQIVSSDIGS